MSKENEQKPEWNFKIHTPNPSLEGSYIYVHFEI